MRNVSQRRHSYVANYKIILHLNERGNYLMLNITVVLIKYLPTFLEHKVSIPQGQHSKRKKV